MSKTFTCEQLAEIMGAGKLSAKAEVEQKLNEYFNGVEANISIKMYANIPHLTIEYLDFKPTKTVRHDIENLLAEVEFDELHRDFSEAVVKELLYNLYVEGMEVILPVDEGLFENCSLIEFVNKKLYHISLPAAGEGAANI